MYGLVFSKDSIPLKEAKTYGLEPLILYGITVPGTPLRWITFSPASEPRSFCSVLFEGWKNAPGLRGPPDTLKIKNYLSEAAPGLASTLAVCGIKIMVEEAYGNRVAASLGMPKTAQTISVSRGGFPRRTQ
jgi:hypothetical protein